MSNFVEIDTSELDRFAAQLQEAAGGAVRDAEAETMERIAEDFLIEVQREIESKGNVDSSALLVSFWRGGGGNVFSVGDGGLEIEVGTDVEYADWVNTGHSQRPGRFIPGYWMGSKFVYDPGAKGGMVLKASWVEGSHYYDEAEKSYRSKYPAEARRIFYDLIRKIFNA